MDTRQLEYILEIAEEKSLSKAAEKLYITQSALSQQLAKLKKEGLPPLFEQKKREMELTDAGKIYINGARSILKLEKDARAALQSLSSSYVSRFCILAAPYLLPALYLHLLPKLHRMFPQTELYIRRLEYGRAHRELESGAADLVFLPTQQSSYDMFRSAILYEDELVIATLPGATPAALPWVVPGAGTHLRNLCNHAMFSNHINTAIYAETDDVRISCLMAQGGDCAAVLPRSCVTDPSLYIHPFPSPFFYHLTAACRKNNHSPVVDTAVNELKSLL
ncbi:MAG: LysR family transcriptional regulator [Eubacteriales bacterium]|nr:LysR family transcriptional regulator [Eubacteriales bacterium]